ncbi:hypothetical protein FC34_GL000386 [Lacticaseibacillus brantae DSM 23927]|uniref:Cell wall elongation regulator TseB-like domain-containing protein n=1 Tax=Lacticaseibacillus brantae DSM 23927 TaxID=1423727 RepID=A0A0R2B3Z0_9LACO|nr:hypothetical protein FC34_GL000386 [Lacticaseibacillus brantae DSM 23927]
MVAIVSLGLWYHHIQSPLNTIRNQAEQIAKDRGKLTTIDDFYWYKHGQSYLAVSGQTAQQKSILVLIRQKDGQVTLLNQKSGISAATAQAQAKSAFKPRKVLDVALGKRKSQVVWDVSFIDSQGKLGYVSYSFKTGNQVRAIRNI